MKRFFAVIFSAIVIAVSVVSLSGCGCSNPENNSTSSSPSTDIVGDWGERSDDVEVEFNDDGTCIIGGIQGTYEIDDDNTLTVTPNSEDDSESEESLVFEYYNSDGEISSVPSNQWTIIEDKLYINGYQYTKENDESSSNSGSSNTNASSDSSSTNSSSSKNNASSSNQNSSNSNSSNSSSNSSGSSSNSSSSNSSSSSSNNNTSSSNSTSSIPEGVDGDEDAVLNIYENLDDF